MSGYVAEEKMEIAKTYLIPAAVKASGIGEDKVWRGAGWCGGGYATVVLECRLSNELR